MAGTGIDDLLVPCSLLEVVAHLAITERGVRQLMRCDFREGFGPEDLSNSEYLTFETVLHSENGALPVVVFNTHPLAVASGGFTDVAVIPPYTFSEDGISISLRGIPSGITRFISMAREIMPPDNIKVVNEDDVEPNLKTCWVNVSGKWFRLQFSGATTTTRRVYRCVRWPSGSRWLDQRLENTCTMPNLQ